MPFISTVFATSSIQSIPLAFNSEQDVLTRIDTIANWIFAVLMIVAVISIILAAFSYLTSGGGENVKTAHRKLLFAAIAVAIAVIAKGIIIVIAKIISAGQANIRFPS